MIETSIQPETSQLHDMQQRLRSRFKVLRNRVRLGVFIEGAAHIVGLIVVALLLSLMFDWWLELSRPMRIIVELCGLGGGGYILWDRIIQPMRQPLDAMTLVSAIDLRCASQLTAHVAAVLQLPGQLPDATPIAAKMIDKAVRHSDQALEQTDFVQRVDTPRTYRYLAAIVVVVMVPILLGMAMPNVTQMWAKRWLMLSNELWPRTTTIIVAGVEDNRLFVPRHEPFPLQIEVRDTAEPTQTLWLSYHGDTSGARASGGRMTDTLSLLSPGRFAYDLPPADRPGRLWLWGGR